MKEILLKSVKLPNGETIAYTNNTSKIQPDWRTRTVQQGDVVGNNGNKTFANVNNAKFIE